MLEAELEKVAQRNSEDAENILGVFKAAFRREGATAEDAIYSAATMQDSPASFTAFVDPAYARDVQENREWYLENSSEVLLNINYPSRAEKHFLRQLELWQQEKNDVNYRHILNLLQNETESLTPAADDSRWQQLSAHKRGLVVQEDAQCAICNNGDYEDEDLIVFCGVCNIPVH